MHKFIFVSGYRYSMQDLNAKDVSLQIAIAKLRHEFGATAFKVVDHWEADTCAVGIAHPDNHEILVYVSTCALPEHGYFVSLELPSEEADLPYRPAGEFNDVDLDNLVRIVRQHLGA